MLPSSAMVNLSKEYEGTEDFTWIWIFHFQEADSQHSPWRSICPPCPLFLQLQFSKPSPPSQPFLQSTSCNKAQIKRLAMFAFCLVYFCVFFGAYSSFTAISWKWIMVSRCLDGPYSPQRDVTHHSDWWWQWWRSCCWWRQWRWWCW